ncbi:MAG: polymerase [Actinomycetota bacterium]
MNAFYVSVELLRHPELVGQPVVVGGTGGRGVVSAASYEARQFGVYSAMSSAMAMKLCPHAVFLPPDMEYYLDYSRQLRDVFESFTPLVESISVDEAFLDVTGSQKLWGDAFAIAEQLRAAVAHETRLPCTVGIAPNKFLAKMASEFAKPKAFPDRIDPGHGIYCIAPGEEIDFLQPLPVKSLWGVGPATRKKLENLGIHTVGDLAEIDVDILCRAVGDAHGRHLHALALGIDDRVVEPDRIAKSIGNEETFSRDLSTMDELRPHLVTLCDSVSRRIRQADVAAGTVMLKVKFSTFETITRSITPSSPLTTGPSMVAALEPLLASIDFSQGVRLLGVHAQKLLTESVASPTLFDLDADSPTEIEEQWVPASRAVDSIVSKFGEGVIGPASALGRPQPGRRPFGPMADDAET